MSLTQLKSPIYRDFGEICMYLTQLESPIYRDFGESLLNNIFAYLIY